MLSIDVYTCYAIAGAGSFVGLGVMSLVRSDQPRIMYATNLFRWALLCLGMLLSIEVGPERLRPELVKLAIGFAGMGVALVAWAFRQLSGRRTHPVFGLSITLVAGGALWLAGGLGQDALYVRTIGAVFCGISVFMAIDQALVMRASQKRGVGEAALLCAACFFAVNWLVILAWAFTRPGPYPSHWLFMPDGLTSITGLGFALLPLGVACGVFVTVNDRLMQQLRARALSDDLTGALSRRGLRELGERMVALQASQASVLAIVMIDIDFFKDVNDRHGHATGDEVLRHVTMTVREHLREDALLARYGGEEFSVLLPVRSRAEAQSIAERLREAVELTPCETKNGEVRVTISVGLSFHSPDTTLEGDLARADAALYRAKHTGRNRVICADVQA